MGAFTCISKLFRSMVLAIRAERHLRSSSEFINYFLHILLIQRCIGFLPIFKTGKGHFKLSWPIRRMVFGVGIIVIICYFFILIFKAFLNTSIGANKSSYTKLYMDYMALTATVLFTLFTVGNWYNAPDYFRMLEKWSEIEKNIPNEKRDKRCKMRYVLIVVSTILSVAVMGTVMVTISFGFKKNIHDEMYKISEQFQDLHLQVLALFSMALLSAGWYGKRWHVLQLTFLFARFSFTESNFRTNH